MILVACATPSAPAGQVPAITRLMSTVAVSANRSYAIASSPTEGAAAVVPLLPPASVFRITPALPAVGVYALPLVSVVPASAEIELSWFIQRMCCDLTLTTFT